jgi:hypothetical protein
MLRARHSPDGERLAGIESEDCDGLRHPTHQRELVYVEVSLPCGLVDRILTESSDWGMDVNHLRKEFTKVLSLSLSPWRTNAYSS